MSTPLDAELQSQEPPPTLSRRRLLGVAAGGLVVGAGATEVGHLLAGGSSTVADRAVAPGETLMYEHGVLKRVLLAYQAAVPHLDGDLPLAAAAIHTGAGIIHDFIEGFHEALEEGYVFPALRAAGQLVPTVDTLLVQHGRGRLITQLLLDAATAERLAGSAARARVVAAVGAFVRMYEPHEAREDTVVFPAFRALSSPARLEEVGQAFGELQAQQFGPSGFASVLERVGALEATLGIDRLASFTPAPVDPSA